jgi:hypothetical protein
MKTLKEFRSNRMLLTPEQYNNKFGHQFSTNPDEPEYMDGLIYLVTYPMGGNIMLFRQEEDQKPFELAIERSTYQDYDLDNLEEILWDWCKTEHYRLSAEEIQYDLNERLKAETDYIVKDSGMRLKKMVSLINGIENMEKTKMFMKFIDAGITMRDLFFMIDAELCNALDIAIVNDISPLEFLGTLAMAEANLGEDEWLWETVHHNLRMQIKESNEK